jgi:hypothetical protein
MYYLDSEKPKSSIMGRHFMASLLWNTESDKMVKILKVMMRTYEEYGLPIDYNALGIIEDE